MIEIDLDCGDAWKNGGAFKNGEAFKKGGAFKKGEAFKKGGAGQNDGEWPALCQRAVAAAFAQTQFDALALAEAPLSVSIILTDDAQVHALNKQYRDKDKPTNVLSFPMLTHEELAQLPVEQTHETLLGDLALAYETTAVEAADKDVSLAQHVTHLIVHGTLHLLGYDHIDDDEAAAMESAEIKALASMGLPNPYNDK